MPSTESEPCISDPGQRRGAPLAETVDRTEAMPDLYVQSVDSSRSSHKRTRSESEQDVEAVVGACAPVEPVPEPPDDMAILSAYCDRTGAQLDISSFADAVHTVPLSSHQSEIQA